MNFELHEKLARVARQIRALRLWTGLALCWFVWAVVGAAILQFAARWGGAPLGWIDVCILAIVSASACAIMAARSVRSERVVARHIEARHPELRTLLLAAVEQAHIPRDQQGYLQASLVAEAVAHGRRHNWTRIVGDWRLRTAKIMQFLSLGLLIGVCIALAGHVGATSGLGSSLFGGHSPAVGYDVSIDPGDCEIERGAALIVIAEFKGRVPADAGLEVSSGAGGGQSLGMNRSLADPKYVARIAAVTEDVSYRVTYDGHTSKTFQVNVFDYPALVRADAALQFPTYTSQEPKNVNDVRHITAVEGTKLVLSCRLNKPVAIARLVASAGDELVLARDAVDGTLYRGESTLTASRRYKLQLRDHEQRTNRFPEDIVVTVTPNRAPQVKLERPARDVEVSALEELQLDWKASDDYGIVRSGLGFTFGGGEPQEIESALSGDQKQQQFSHLIEFETLHAKPDDLLSYFVWAEDIGPDGKHRRVESDMYFAEVRPFEQIFRQGDQPTEGEQQQQQQQGPPGNGQRAEELAEMQKQIINATWTLIRRETGDTPSAEFKKDSTLVKETQQSALSRAAEIAASLEDPESGRHLESALVHMRRALTQLTVAVQQPDPGALPPAMVAERMAYQDLLKLRAREFEVVRGNRQQRGAASSRGNRMQRQLDQLELSADENRYETQSRARAPEQNRAQQESRDILNKLRDLARRQEDLNDRIRELQSALEKAQSLADRSELERELKRLRDQQQEILRDTDEMIARNEQSAGAPEQQASRERMEQGRSHVEQASKALDEGDLSRAGTEGARASRELNELRDDFRKQSANQFADDMTEMRRDARNVEAQQQELSRQLTEQNSAPGRSLRPTDDQAETQDGVRRQQEDVHNLLERMKQTIEAAEEPEPLLARQLYEAAREANQKRLEDTLDAARRLIEAGVRPQAGEAMKAAEQGVSNLRRGVERAAGSVLGDEAESLRRAQTEVDRLAAELNREIAERTGTATDEQPDERPTAPASARNGNSQQATAQSKSTGEQQGGGGIQKSNESEQPPSTSEAGQSEDGKRQTADAEGSTDDEARSERPQASNDPGSESGNTSASRERSSLRGGNREQNGGSDNNDLRRLLGGGVNQGTERSGGGPITGREFRDWSDRLRDVEEMLDDAELRSDAARIRDRAADARTEFRKHASEPNWTELRTSIAEPLIELSRRLDNEIRKLESPDARVPIDRDPIPLEFTERVRRYYERLGSGE